MLLIESSRVEFWILELDSYLCQVKLKLTSLIKWPLKCARDRLDEWGRYVTGVWPRVRAWLVYHKRVKLAWAWARVRNPYQTIASILTIFKQMPHFNHTRLIKQMPHPIQKIPNLPSCHSQSRINCTKKYVIFDFTSNKPITNT